MKSTVLAACFGALACGGGQSSTPGPAAPPAGGGQDAVGEEPSSDSPPLAGSDTGAESGEPIGEQPADSGDQGGEEPTDGGTLTLAPVSFVLVNTADEDLVFSVDKGWQPNIFAFSGTPPKATPIIMFSKHCTNSCDMSAEEICPVCEEPATAKDEREAEQREVVAPGQFLPVPWDGKVFVYEKTRGRIDGKKARCECWQKTDPPPAEYTVRACGLRVTKQAGKRSQMQCVDGTMTLPPADGAIEVRLEFPAVAKKKKKKKGHR